MVLDLDTVQKYYNVPDVLIAADESSEMPADEVKKQAAEEAGFAIIELQSPSMAMEYTDGRPQNLTYGEYTANAMRETSIGDPKLEKTTFPDTYGEKYMVVESQEVRDEKVEALIKSMTAEEKFALLGGGANGTVADAGTLTGVPRLGVPQMRMFEGPAGVTSIYDTTNPPIEQILGSTWSTDLAYDYGKISRSANKAISGSVQLGSQFDITRTAHFGRSKDQVGEDPYHVSRMAVSETEGIQDQNVMETLKHFAVFTQDSTPGGAVDVQVDEQTLHELYLAPFEAAVKEADAAAIMSSYNGVWLSDEHFKVIGVRLGRGIFDVSLAGLSGKPYGVWEHRTGVEGSLPSSLRAVRSAMRSLMREYPESEVLTVCVAVPGPYHEEEDRLLFVTGTEGWKGCSVKGTLSEGLSMPLYVINDANASAFAQLWYHSKDQGVENKVYVLAGQGVGYGMIVDVKLILGQQGIAGEFGHSSINFNGPPCACGNRGCLEKNCSMTALRERILELIRSGRSSCLAEIRLTTLAVTAAVRAGEHVACEAYREVCDFLATGIVGLINQLNPGRVIIGDELAEIHPGILLDVVRRRIENNVNPLVIRNLSIEVNQLHESPSLLGASVYAAHQELSNPIRLLSCG